MRRRRIGSENAENILNAVRKCEHIGIGLLHKPLSDHRFIHGFQRVKITVNIGNAQGLS